MTNPANGKSVVAVALDYGPGCPGENAVMKEVLDSSGRVNRYLFGSDKGARERAHALVGRRIGRDTAQVGNRRARTCGHGVSP